MDKTLQIQAQIRQNAEGISAALTDMSKWEKQIKVKDKSIIEQTINRSKAPIRTGAGTVSVKSAGSVATSVGKDNDNDSNLNPSTVVNKFTTSSNKPTEVSVPKARGVYHNVDPEEAERERGNAEFKNGNFSAAVKSYTKCLGLKNKNYIAFSNRAMAYLKLKEFHRAVTDCNCALSIDVGHVKSLLRRATAFNALGRHRAALKDLLVATDLEPANKQVRAELQNTRELLRSAVNRAPLVSVPVLYGDVGGDGEGISLAPQQGPDPAPATHISSISDILNIKPIEKKSSSSGDLPVKTTNSGAAAAEIVETATEAAVVRGGMRRIAVSAAESDEESGDEVDIPIHSSATVATTASIDTSICASTTASPAAVKDQILVATQSMSATGSSEGRSSGLSRIAITEDEDEEPVVSATPTQTQVTTPSTASTGASTKKTVIVSSSSSITSSASKHSKAKEANEAKEVTPKKKSAGSAPSPAAPVTSKKYSAYELERDLVQSRMELPALKAILSHIKLSNVTGVLSGLMEPTVLFLLLKAIYLYYSSTQQHVKVVSYFEKIASSSSFGLVHSLLPADEREAVAVCARDACQQVCGDADNSQEARDKAERVVQLYI